MKKLNIGPGDSALYFKNLKDWELMDADRGRRYLGLTINFNHFDKISRSSYDDSNITDFSFETELDTEARQFDRSMCLESNK